MKAWGVPYLVVLGAAVQHDVDVREVCHADDAQGQVLGASLQLLLQHAGRTVRRVSTQQCRTETRLAL